MNITICLDVLSWHNCDCVINKTLKWLLNKSLSDEQ